MSEDLTKELRGGTPFERRMLAEFAALRSEVGSLRSEVAEIRTQQIAMAKNIAALDQSLTSVDGRLTSLEEKVDSRLKETRPIWEAVMAKIEKLDEKFNVFILDLYDIRATLRIHEKRFENLELRISS